MTKVVTGGKTFLHTDTLLIVTKANSEYLFEIKFVEKFFQEYHQSVKQFGS